MKEIEDDTNIFSQPVLNSKALKIEIPPEKQNNFKGCMFMLLQTINYSLFYLFSKTLTKTYNVNLFYQNFAMGILGMIYVLVEIKRKNLKVKPLLQLKSTKQFNFILRSSLGGTGFVLSVVSIWYIKTSSMTSIVYLYPLLSLVMGAVFFGEKLSVMDIASCLVSFLGTLIANWQPADKNEVKNHFQMVGYALAGMSAFSYALLPEMSKSLKGVVKTEFIIFTINYIITATSPIFLFWSPDPPIFNVISVFYLCLVALFSVLGLILFEKAFEYGQVAKVMSMEYFVIPFSLLFSSILYGNTVQVQECLGISLIIGVNLLKMVLNN